MDGDKVVSPACFHQLWKLFAGDFRFHHYRIFYFYVVKGINALNKKKEEAPAAPALLQPIYKFAYRDTDLLKDKK